ncbi:MAG TPA: polysaccharide deacetylase family protein [Steroidobacteraceae bacterium]|nr:polysaccharide deacetylase family protein [Steroidobacteraceae bacterium]
MATEPRQVALPSHRGRATPLMSASLAAHVAMPLLVLVHWPLWPWALGVLLADHILLFTVGLIPRSHALGQNWTRLPPACAAGGHIAITIDDGPDPEVTPQVLRILAAYGAQASFFCIGERAERYPALVRACVQAGHAVENHSYRHRRGFALLGWWRMGRELEQAQQRLTELAGVAPRFFRAPAGLRSPLLDPLLQRVGLQLASWTRRGFDTVSTDADSVLARLSRNLHAGDILVLHDGHAARSARGEPVVVQVLPRLLELIAARRLRTITLRAALPQAGA